MRRARARRRRDRASRRHLAPARRPQQPGSDHRQGDRPAARRRRPRHARARADRHRRCRRAAWRRLPRRPHRDPYVVHAHAPWAGVANRHLRDAARHARVAAARAEPQMARRARQPTPSAGRDAPAPRRSSPGAPSRHQLSTRTPPRTTQGGPMYRTMTRTAIPGCAALLGVAALCWMIAPAPRRHGDGLERVRVDRDRRQRRAAAARCRVELRDGAGRRLRRGERNRPRPSPLPHRAAGHPLGLKGRCGGDRGVPRPRRPLPDPAVNAATALRHVARRNPGHATRHEGGRGRHRRRGSSGDARRPSRTTAASARSPP